MIYGILKYIVFFVCFGWSFYALSSLCFDKICAVHEPQKVRSLLFLLSLALAYVTSQAILSVTVLNGWGI